MPAAVQREHKNITIVFNKNNRKKTLKKYMYKGYTHLSPSPVMDF